jgi:hypothetical protein
VSHRYWHGRICHEFAAHLTICVDGAIMADSIAKKRAEQANSSDDSSTAGPEIFATVSSILVKQILDLREALEFYEMQLFHMGSGAGEPLQEHSGWKCLLS